MNSTLQKLAARLSRELGLVANLITTSHPEKIVGGVSHETRDGIGMYVRKFEVTFDERVYRARLPLGQTFIEKEAGSDTEIYEAIASHFRSTDE
jgi:hypothetical protein